MRAKRGEPRPASKHKKLETERGKSATKKEQRCHHERHEEHEEENYRLQKLRWPSRASCFACVPLNRRAVVAIIGKI
jgi:hypothetical protein